MRRLMLIAVVVGMVVMVSGQKQLSSIVFYVSPNGNDTWSWLRLGLNLKW
ncbi:MAG: hypothetical protein ACUVTP_12725 [Candidatus Fervidibacter sp.]